MGDSTIPYSALDPSMDSVDQWIDTSLISDPALLHLMESYNSLPFNGFEFGSTNASVQDFALNANQSATNNFELSTGSRDGYPLSELARKPSIVRSDPTFGSRSTSDQASQVQEGSIQEEVTKVKKEVSDRPSWSYFFIHNGS